jgi:hypothetical protein
MLNPALQPRHVVTMAPIEYADDELSWSADMIDHVTRVVEGSWDAESIKALKSHYSQANIQSVTADLFYYDILPARNALVLVEELDYVIEQDIWWARQIEPLFAELRAHPRFGEYLEAAGIIAYWDATEWTDWCQRNADNRVICK